MLICNKCDNEITDAGEINQFWLNYPQFLAEFSGSIPKGLGFCKKCLSGMLFEPITEEKAFELGDEIASVLKNGSLIKKLGQEIPNNITDLFFLRIFLENLIHQMPNILRYYFFLENQEKIFRLKDLPSNTK